MILSMTGFGRAVAQSKTHKITVEVKSLNLPCARVWAPPPNAEKST